MSKGARVIVRQPKMELTSLRKPRPAARRPSPPPEPPRVELNLMTMYENRNQQLSEELTREAIQMTGFWAESQVFSKVLPSIQQGTLRYRVGP